MQTAQFHFVYGINGIGVLAEGDPNNPDLSNIDTIDKKPLRVKSLNGQTLFCAAAPKFGWSLPGVKNSISHVDTSGGADLYLGDLWLGSTEV
jgi:hypothetical protein